MTYNYYMFSDYSGAHPKLINHHGTVLFHALAPLGLSDPIKVSRAATVEEFWFPYKS